jgi:hypothetical protein
VVRFGGTSGLNLCGSLLHHGTGVRFKRRSPLKKKTRRGFHGFPVATIAWYGPDDQRASKVAVGIIIEDGGEPQALERWFSKDQDIRQDRVIGAEIHQFIRSHGVKSVVASDGIMGCPHEEGIDYPDGQTCPECPFWAGRDRLAGESES